jgi:hypothetical protein
MLRYTQHATVHTFFRNRIHTMTAATSTSVIKLMPISKYGLRRNVTTQRAQTNKPTPKPSKKPLAC